MSGRHTGAWCLSAVVQADAPDPGGSLFLFALAAGEAEGVERSLCGERRPLVLPAAAAIKSVMPHVERRPWHEQTER